MELIKYPNLFDKGRGNYMKTWEIYKELDEWSVSTVSPIYKNKANELNYKFVFDGEKKGLKLVDEKYRGKVQYHFSLNGEWEKVEHLYNVGDWVVNIRTNKLHRIREQLHNSQYLNEIGSTLHENYLRLATKQEIRLLEKWNGIGRNMNEFKKWDIVKDIDGTFGFNYREVLSVRGEFLRCTGGVDIHESNARLITPLDRRFDIE